MNQSKNRMATYWIFTLLVLLPTAGSAIPELFTQGPTTTVQSLHALGYPIYLMKILAVAKILGAIAILINRSPTLSEWAYAGFTFLLLGATASHLLAGDFSHAPIPLVVFALLMGSYVCWSKPVSAGTNLTALGFR